MQVDHMAIIRERLRSVFSRLFDNVGCNSEADYCGELEGLWKIETIPLMISPCQSGILVSSHRKYRLKK